MRAPLLAASRQSFLSPYRELTPVWSDALPDGSEARVYQTNTVVASTTPGAEVYTLIAFVGKSGKPAEHTLYRRGSAPGQSARAWAIGNGSRFLQNQRERAERRQKDHAERVSYQTTLEVGNVLVNSWGYDQTNIDYYEVTAVSPTRKTITIRKIGAKSVDDAYMQGTCWPMPGHYIGEPMTKHVLPGDAVKIHDWGSWARLWRGGLDRWTAYA